MERTTCQGQERASRRMPATLLTRVSSALNFISPFVILFSGIFTFNDYTLDGDAAMRRLSEEIAGKFLGTIP